MRYDDDDQDIPPPTAELDGPDERTAHAVLQPVRAPRPVGSAATHLLAAAVGALFGALAMVAAAALYGAYGAGEYEALVAQVEATPPTPAPPPAPAPRGLRAIDGKAVSFVPSGRVQLVNVWLEGCADCMPSFEAWKKVVADERLPSGIAISNVAYMRASEDYVRRYRVSEGLVIDDGTNVVRPLGISRFTTLVVAPNGTVCHRDDPAVAGYVERLRAAIERCAEPR